MHAQLDREGLVRRWSALAFVDGWERAWRRRPADVGRLVGGAVATAVLTALVHAKHPFWSPHWELPGFVSIALLTTAWLGLGLPGATVVLVSLLRRRWWVPLSVAVSALIGGLLMLWLRMTSPGSATVLIAGTWAGVTCIWPMVRPTAHRWYAVGITAWAVFEIATGQGSVADVLQALTIGFTVGCLARVATGTVTGDPEAAVLAVTADLGLRLTDVTPSTSGLDGAQRFTACDPDGSRVVVDLYGRDYTQAQVWKGLLRYAWYRGSRVPVMANRLQRLEHHLAVLGQANASGGTKLRVVTAGLGGPTSDAVLVTVAPTAEELAALPDGVDDLDGAWASVAALAGAGIAHRSLTGTTVRRASDGHWYVDDLRTATLAATEQDLLADRAALLAATARHAGVTTAVAAAGAALGSDGLAAVVPLLQPSALPRATKEERHFDKTLLPELRGEASTAAGVEPPDLAKLYRVSPVDLAMVAGTLLGLWILVGELANLDDIGQTLKGATWSWLVLAFFIGLLPNLTEASALAGAVAEPLPFRPLVGLRLADGFLGLVGGTVATTAAAIRFFQLRGLAASVAVTSGLLYSLTGFADQMVLCLLAFIPAHEAFTLSSTDATSSSGGSSDLHTLLVIAIAVLVVLGIALAVPRVRRLAAARVIPQLSQARDNLRELASRPAKLVQLFGSNAVSQLLFALCLGLCLRGFGGSTSLSVLILVNTAAALLGGIAPIPGGMGVVEAGLIAGLTAAGVPQQQAIAATFAYRLITAYLPPIWGWPSMVWLRRHDYL